MREELGIAAYVIGIVGIVFTFFLWPGIIQLEPNEARAMVFSVLIRERSEEPGFSGLTRS